MFMISGYSIILALSLKSQKDLLSEEKGGMALFLLLKGRERKWQNERAKLTIFMCAAVEKH